MDGNRRWARQRGLPFEFGYKKGAETLMKIVDKAISLEIGVLTVYVFSTENWNRPLKEIQALMRLLKAYLHHKRKAMVKKGIKLEVIGNITPFPEEIKEALFLAKKATEKGKKLQLVLALNYGGRDDLRRAMEKIAQAFKEGKIQEKELTESLISNHLDTCFLGDPDLLIRPSGEKRLSNFFLWQISYCEFYLTETLWPDFTVEDFDRAVFDYQRRSRRLGI